MKNIIKVLVVVLPVEMNWRVPFEYGINKKKSPSPLFQETCVKRAIPDMLNYTVSKSERHPYKGYSDGLIGKKFLRLFGTSKPLE